MEKYKYRKINSKKLKKQSKNSGTASQHSDITHTYTLLALTIIWVTCLLRHSHSQFPSRRLVYLGSLRLHSKDPTRSLHVVLVSFTASRAVLLWQFIRNKEAFGERALAENCLLSVNQISKGQRNITWSLTKRIITDSSSFLSQMWDKLCFVCVDHQKHQTQSNTGMTTIWASNH